MSIPEEEENTSTVELEKISFQVWLYFHMMNYTRTCFDCATKICEINRVDAIGYTGVRSFPNGLVSYFSPSS